MWGVYILIEGRTVADRCQRNQDRGTHSPPTNARGSGRFFHLTPRPGGELRDNGAIHPWDGEMIPIYPRSEIIRYKAPVQVDVTATYTGLPGWPLCGGDSLFLTGLQPGREFVQPTMDLWGSMLNLRIPSYILSPLLMKPPAVRPLVQKRINQ